MMKAFQITVDNAMKLNERDWIFELKIDGAREFWIKDRLVSCRNVSHDERYKNLYGVLVSSEINAVLDGEISLPYEWKSNVLELNKKENWNVAVYYVFDCLEWKGMNLRDRPLIERQQVLRRVVAKIDSTLVRFVPQFNSFIEGWDFVVHNDFEGIMAKRLSSTYSEGGEGLIGKEFRSKDWFKIKNWKEGLDEIVGHSVGETEKGSFKLKSGTSINCPDLETLREYDNAVKNDKRVFAEFYYRFKSKNGFYSPILKRLVPVKTPMELFTVLKGQLDMEIISGQDFEKAVKSLGLGFMF